MYEVPKNGVFAFLQMGLGINIIFRMILESNGTVLDFFIILTKEIFHEIIDNCRKQQGKAFETILKFSFLQEIRNKLMLFLFFIIRSIRKLLTFDSH